MYRVDLYVFMIQSVSHLWAVGSNTKPERGKKGELWGKRKRKKVGSKEEKGRKPEIDYDVTYL